MNGDVIREFLVGLGCQVDEAGLRSFNEGLAKATKTAMTLAKEVVAAGAAVAAGVTKIASQYEDLYYASQRLHASVTNIRAYRYAIGQMGGDTKTAMASLEAVASFVRSNPGGEGFIHSLGVQTRNANGELRDTTDIMKDL